MNLRIDQRAVASQMADAKMLRTSVEITGDNDGAPATFNASQGD
jgi:hypothetical protein